MRKYFAFSFFLRSSAPPEAYSSSPLARGSRVHRADDLSGFRSGWGRYSDDSWFLADGYLSTAAAEASCIHRACLRRIAHGRLVLIRGRLYASPHRLRRGGSSPLTCRLRDGDRNVTQCCWAARTFIAPTRRRTAWIVGRFAGSRLSISRRRSAQPLDNGAANSTKLKCRRVNSSFSRSGA